MHSEKSHSYIPCFILLLVLSSARLSAQSGFPVFPFLNSIQSESDMGFYLMDASPYAFITDDHGIPVYQQYISGGIQNFTPLDDSSFAVYIRPLRAFLILNRQMLPADTIYMSGEYEVDFHHISRRENGNLILLGKEVKTIDMSGTIWEGSPDASVSGAVIQEFDTEMNPLYEWKSLDHLPIGDSLSCSVDPRAQSIDYIHVNSVQADTDSTWIISCRNLDQVIKVHKEIGGILWRLGGVGNQFTFTNDSLRFSAQHSVHLHGKDVLSLFDNGNCKTEKNSRALVYSLNQEEKSITLTKELSHSPEVFSLIMGNYILLPEEQSLVGWGKNSRKVVFTHYRGAHVLHEMSIRDEYPFYSYAVHPVEWFSPVEIKNEGPLNPGAISMVDSLVLELEFHNTLNQEVRQAGFHFEGAKMEYLDTAFLVLAPGEERMLKVLCIPEKTGQFEGRMTVYFRYRSDSLAPIVGSQVQLNLDVTGPNAIRELQCSVASMDLFPNPANLALMIDLPEAVDRLEIYSMSGVLQKEISQRSSGSLTISISELAAGSYFILGTGQSGNIIKATFIKGDY